MGDSMCDFKLIQETMRRIAETPNVYCILNGDLMDTAVCSSIGDTYGANLQPMEQLRRCVDLFGPSAEKIIAITPGNHENRVYKSDGIDIVRMFAAQLGIEERYSDTAAYIFLRFQTACSQHGHPVRYTIYVSHGSGGGRKEGGKVNRLADLASICDADVYVHSHTHMPFIMKERYFRVDPTHANVFPVDKLFVNTASFLDYGGYGERNGYKPSSKDNPVICFSGRKRSFQATL
jgi:predicted phosphodiesterase